MTFDIPPGPISASSECTCIPLQFPCTNQERPCSFQNPPCAYSELLWAWLEWTCPFPELSWTSSGPQWTRPELPWVRRLWRMGLVPEKIGGFGAGGGKASNRSRTGMWDRQSGIGNGQSQRAGADSLLWPMVRSRMPRVCRLAAPGLPAPSHTLLPSPPLPSPLSSSAPPLLRVLCVAFCLSLDPLIPRSLDALLRKPLHLPLLALAGVAR